MEQMRESKATAEEETMKFELDKQTRDEMIASREERIDTVEKEVKELTRAEEKNLAELEELEARLESQTSMHLKEMDALRRVSRCGVKGGSRVRRGALPASDEATDALRFCVGS